MVDDLGVTKREQTLDEECDAGQRVRDAHTRVSTDTVKGMRTSTLLESVVTGLHFMVEDRGV
jgi:hypothetical protein